MFKRAKKSDSKDKVREASCALDSLTKEEIQELSKEVFKQMHKEWEKIGGGRHA